MHLNRSAQSGRFVAGAILTLEERFWSKVNKNGPTVRPEIGPCWLWTASTDGHGYGQISVTDERGKRPHKAHHISYTLAFGVPVPSGRDLCHTCDVRACVRPSHLFVGTRLDNVTDAVGKSRHSHGRGRPAVKLTEDQVREIRAIPRDTMTQPEIAALYSVSRSVVEHIRLGKAWRHVK